MQKKIKSIAYNNESIITLPEGYTLNNGLLIKNDTIISLATSGILQTAEEGFLHVDENEKYETK